MHVHTFPILLTLCPVLQMGAVDLPPVDLQLNNHTVYLQFRSDVNTARSRVFVNGQTISDPEKGVDMSDGGRFVFSFELYDRQGKKLDMADQIFDMDPLLKAAPYVQSTQDQKETAVQPSRKQPANASAGSSSAVSKVSSNIPDIPAAAELPEQKPVSVEPDSMTDTRPVPEVIQVYPEQPVSSALTEETVQILQQQETVEEPQMYNMPAVGGAMMQQDEVPVIRYIQSEPDDEVQTVRTPSETVRSQQKELPEQKTDRSQAAVTVTSEKEHSRPDSQQPVKEESFPNSDPDPKGTAETGSIVQQAVSARFQMPGKQMETVWRFDGSGELCTSQTCWNDQPVFVVSRDLDRRLYWNISMDQANLVLNGKDWTPEVHTDELGLLYSELPASFKNQSLEIRQEGQDNSRSAWSQTFRPVHSPGLVQPLISGLAALVYAIWLWAGRKAHW